jgi:flagellar hook-length control protein FliK
VPTVGITPEETPAAISAVRAAVHPAPDAAAAQPIAEPQRAAILAKPDATASPTASLPAAPLAASAGGQPRSAWKEPLAPQPIEPESPRPASGSIAAREAALRNRTTASAAPEPAQVARGQAAGEIAAPRGESVASPAQQVVSALAQAVSQNSPGVGPPPAAAAPPPPAVSAPFGGPLRVLRIELRPEALGHVTATMHLREGGLALRLEASAEVADLLRRDRHTLSDLLAGAGYAVDAQQVEIVEAPPAIVQTAQPQNQQQASSQSGFEGRFGGFPQGADPGDRQPPRSPTRDGAEEREAKHAPAPANARTGLYL